MMEIISGLVGIGGVVLGAYLFRPRVEPLYFPQVANLTPPSSIDSSGSPVGAALERTPETHE